MGTAQKSKGRLQSLAGTLSKKQLANMGYGTKSKIKPSASKAKPSARVKAGAADSAQIQERLRQERALGLKRGRRR